MLLLEHLFNFASLGHGTKITVTCRNHYSDDACLYPEVGDDLGLGVQQLQKVNVLQVTHSMLAKTKKLGNEYQQRYKRCSLFVLCLELSGFQLLK